MCTKFQPVVPGPLGMSPNRVLAGCRYVASLRIYSRCRCRAVVNHGRRCF